MLAGDAPRTLDLLREARQELSFAAQLAGLPPPVARFQWRARRLARRTGDEFSLQSATRPAKLRVLLDQAQGRRRVVELGTATAWTTASLLLADPQRQVVSLDPVVRAERERYLALIPPAARERARLVNAAGEDGPISSDPVELIYVDSSHSREGTIRELRAWRAALGPGAIVVLDDFGHPAYPGVREAVLELGLQGEERAGLFLHRVA